MSLLSNLTKHLRESFSPSTIQENRDKPVTFDADIQAIARHATKQTATVLNDISRLIAEMDQTLQSNKQINQQEPRFFNSVSNQSNDSRPLDGY